MSELPEDLRYTQDHEWAREIGPQRIRVGLTDYAQQQLGEVVFVHQKDEGTEVAAGDVLGEVESVKVASDIYAPVAGRIVAVNSELADDPELVNTDPYDEGWLMDLELTGSESATAVLAGLLDAQAYATLIAG
ncbi:glycine cleavage system protein GcvH [Skermania piniformis]|uniref:Glycine cleavage system H protein n=1 Tax=Skermania pinensis TaxID=39122 RepID=A0ABX8S4U0_9ACTN|nr:glycine cleavage system protein GcvH [Skermania piniformis]QXQ12461.1 glycine cleavage system protein GcvH [Skermania piniformis]